MCIRDRPGFAAGEMRPNGSKGRGGNGSRVWEKRKAPAFAEMCIRDSTTPVMRLSVFASARLANSAATRAPSNVAAAHTASAVSYTHLDVYKRQVVPSAPE